MILHGNNIIIKADGTVIAAAKSCSIEVAASLIPICNPSDGMWEKFRAGRKSWNVTMSHLVTNIVEHVDMTGTEVSLEIAGVQLGDSARVLPFVGTVYNPTIQSYSTTLDGDIVWDTYRRVFLKRVTSLSTYRYYISWQGSVVAYTAPTAGNLYYNSTTNVLYRFNGTSMVAVTLSGNAIVKTWRGTFTRGNLAQGSFVFQGNGELG